MEPVIKKATIEDIPLLLQLRIDFLEAEQGKINPEKKEIICNQLTQYFRKHLETGDFIGLIAEINQEPVSTAFMIMNERPANLSFPTGLTGTILNVFTYPLFRKQQLASGLVIQLIEIARKMNISLLELNATEMGISLYKKLGFKEIPYSSMRLKL